ncbi:uncharacterized protein DUF4422 [Microbacterium kyungheense]|uniref:Uncharacterized protein DUF4422 n=1 Tax=Microbacterium kyungheense TaxID=1263636 RepID=A0A543FJP6_9MICO|nr:uncharacterized protein DUF4422 [Microbacterium kyungheense]
MDPAYLPVHVGKARSDLNLGYQSDADGANISLKNESYCELTAIYWAWKNLQADAIGLSHYRRYFRGDAPGPSGSNVLSGNQMTEIMAKSDIAIGRPRNYVVETVESHYRHGHHGSDLDAVRMILADAAPDYVPSFEAVMQSRRLSLYNMFLMRAEVFNSYAAWLFPILEASEPLIDNAKRDSYQRRTQGYLGERLLNVWVRANMREFRVKLLPIVNTEGEPKLTKGVNMLRRKVSGSRRA